MVRTGMTVGRYISPTIYDYLERWRRNKEWASEEDVADAITVVKEAVDGMVADGLASPTAFEVETAAAFYLFKKWKCDVMLIECGLGGRLDATNVIETDVLNVLASISRDHMETLGDTVEEITREKLGIVRDRTVLVTYPQEQDVMTEINNYCVEHQVKLIAADPEELVINAERFYGSSFTYRGEDYEISMGGRYQIYNAITAIEILKYFKDVCEDEIYAGLLTTRWDARFTTVCTDPVVIIDGAHNEDAWYRLRESLEKYFTNRNIEFIIGVLADKEYEKMIRILKPVIAHAYAVEPDSPRALSKAVLAEKLNEAGILAEESETLEGAIEAAMARATRAKSAGKSGVSEKPGMSEKPGNSVAAEKSVVVICGTLSITGDALRYFESRE